MTTACTRNLPHTIDGGYTVGSEHVAVGDLNSKEPGSGARKNAGKPQMDLIPVNVWRIGWSRHFDYACDDRVLARLDLLLEALEEWQEGSVVALDNYLCRDLIPLDTAEAVKVFEFGANKYKAWNWAKGMKWSVPTGCILRHAQKILGGEEYDEESGHSHMGHIVCNLIMLHRYQTTYPEGDDRPPRNAA